MIVSTINVNGIRAAIKQRSPENLGLLPWLANTTADVVCLQETRADDDNSPRHGAGTVRRMAPGGRRSTSQGAQRRRHALPSSDHRDAAVECSEFDSHGRYVEIDTAGLTVASVYIQTGEAGTDRQLEKERFMAALARGWPR